jgi:hypothetical protein
VGRPSHPVAARRRQVELSVERSLEGRGAPGTVARLSTTLEMDGDGERPPSAELARALDELIRDLDGLLGPPLTAAPAARVDRTLDELVETYRPRQRELVDLLLADGEISPGEHASLLASLGDRPVVPSGARAVPQAPPPGETPIAAVPVAAEPKLPPSRPVPELLRTFQISTLRQAGAVRARRQISFAEYMALKRHFESAGGVERSQGAPSA